LSDALGLNVSVGQVRESLQGVTQIEQVVLAEPETGAVIGRIRHLEFGRQDGQWVVLASQPEIEGEHIWRLWELLHERVLRGRAADALDGLFYAGEITIRQAGGQSATTLIQTATASVGATQNSRNPHLHSSRCVRSCITNVPVRS